ncbi:MAG: hypothetical protein ABJI69_10025 [Balneola sp.]
MEWYWIILIGFGCFCLGWGISAMFGAGKVSDLEFQLLMETRNKDHWKKKTWELIAETRNDKQEA